MTDKIDLSKLTHQQLVNLVTVRGQALEMHHDADHKFMELIDFERLTREQFVSYVQAKNGILAGLMTAEEQILAGYEKPPVAN